MLDQKTMGTNDTQGPNPETPKIERLLEYLLRVATLRTKKTRRISDYEEVLWLSDIPKVSECFTLAWGRNEEYESDVWLEVQNRREPELPAVPFECQDWINHSLLNNKKELPELHTEITCQIKNPDWVEGTDEPETILSIEYLEDHPEVQKKWDYYIEHKWLPWTDKHNSWKTIQMVYSALFTIHQAQLRLGEQYELVLGLGLLTWQTPSEQRVRRHLIIGDAILQFEARLGKFTVRPHTDGVKLRPELDMLDITEQPAQAEEIASSSLISAQDDPWEKGCVEGVLQSLVHSIDSKGEYLDSLESNNASASPKPVVEYTPALILRKRSTKGLTEILKRIKEQIENGANIPREFADLAGISQNDSPESPDRPETANSAFDGEIFFPKPSNDEQQRIVEKIRTASGVLVQGPPGTGKSHTIANLICHLLATGQRTLITAKTPRALQVLEGLVPEELRPLCINLLGTGLEERRSLESSVGGILRKNEEWNEDDAKRKRTEFEHRLQKLREEKVKVNRRLRDIRESETYSQSIAEGAYQGTAARIAEAVNRDRSEFDWFEDTVSLEKTCQIQPQKLGRILDNLRHFTKEKRHECSQEWPHTLPSSDRFASLVSIELNATEEVHKATCEADKRIATLLEKNNSSNIKTLRDALSIFLTERKMLMARHYPWMNSAIRDILGGNSSQWNKRLCITQDVISSVEDLVNIADETTVEFPDSLDIKALYNDTHILQEFTRNGGKLGWGIFRPKVVKDRLYVIKSVKVGGRTCSSSELLSTLVDALNVRISCEKAWGFWAGLSDKIQGPYELQLTALKDHHNALKNALSLEKIIAQCHETISLFFGLADPVWTDKSEVKTLISSCTLALACIKKSQAVDAINCLETPVSRIATKSNAHPVVNDLLNAIRGRKTKEFARCVNKIQVLEREHQHLQKLEHYLSELRGLLPNLSDCLEETCDAPHWEKRIEHICDAWHWAQARYWIETYIKKEDIPALAKRAKQIEDEINNIIAKLASIHAWAFCFSRLKETHRRHMEAWQQSMRRLGKGTGKYAPRHRREAQGHLNECREAVPAWVMPLHRVWDTICPDPGMFDVIIVDEASQCGLEALPLLYLGKKILIVGDDKQISPDAVGLPRDAVFRLMEEFLHDFQFKSTFNIESSLFDHGKLRYGTRQITLREHFRCMPEIIRFSNDLCYSNTPLIPLRQYGPDRLPPLEHIFVKGGYREGKNSRAINRPEADAIVMRIVEMCNDSRYDTKSMGVVVLQGNAQAGLIEDKLLKSLGAAEMEKRRLICGNPYSFQGDERDIIFLSLVAASNERIGPLTKPADERRFNVAASRARDQMLLFHSVTSTDLSVSDLRRKLVNFFENSGPKQIQGTKIEQDELERRAIQDNRLTVKPPKPFDSWFEVDVALELLRKDYVVLIQYEVAGKWIDLVVDGGQARLAIECDGDHWHGPDRYDADMQRQRQLERCGWEFFRVRESAFYANKSKTLKQLWSILEEREIFPESHVRNQQTDNDEKAQDTKRNLFFDKWINSKSEKEEKSSNYSKSADNKKNIPERVIRRTGKVSTKEIQNAIISALSKCANNTCTVQSMVSRVLKEMKIVTRGKPRQDFEQRVRRSLNTLEEKGAIEKYRAKNNRVRLLEKQTQCYINLN